MMRENWLEAPLGYCNDRKLFKPYHGKLKLPHHHIQSRKLSNQKGPYNVRVIRCSTTLRMIWHHLLREKEARHTLISQKMHQLTYGSLMVPGLTMLQRIWRSIAKLINFWSVNQRFITATTTSALLKTLCPIILLHNQSANLFSKDYEDLGLWPNMTTCSDYHYHKSYTY